MLRKICVPVYDDEEGALARRHNMELREMTGVLLISDMVRAQRSRGAGHVAHREEESLVNAVALLLSAGMRPAGRPRKRWKDTIGEDMRMLGVHVVKIDGVQDRERWRDIAAAVRGLQAWPETFWMSECNNNFIENCTQIRKQFKQFTLNCTSRIYSINFNALAIVHFLSNYQNHKR